MNITFGILTSNNSNAFLDVIIKSIVSQGIEHYEILVVGGGGVGADLHIRHIPFDESVKKAWITRKKNLICQEAKYETIVLMHDYVALEDGWYEGFKKFGEDFQICVNPIKRVDGSRYRDYVFFTPKLEGSLGSAALVPYDVQVPHPLNRLLYVSGAYYVIKKSAALENPLCENLGWGEGEDVVFSKELTGKGISIQCNPYSSVRLLKHKDKLHFEQEMSRDKLAAMIAMDPDVLYLYDTIQRHYLVEELKNLCEDHKKLLLE